MYPPTLSYATPHPSDLNNVTLRVKDASLNEHTCTTTVTVQDSIAPVAHCKSATIQLDASGSATLSASDVNDNSTDNCAVTVVEISKDGVMYSPTLSYGCADLGSANNVTLRVKDASLNEHTCTTTVTVQDSIAPVAHCKSATIQLDASGSAKIGRASGRESGTGNYEVAVGEV